VVLLAAAVWGWGAASFWLASGSQVLDTSKEAQYGRASGIFYTATHLGLVCGLLTLGWWVRAYPDSPAFLWSAFAATGLGNLVCLLVPRRRVPRDPPSVRAVLAVAVGPVGRVIAGPLVASSLGYGLLLGIFAAAIGDRFGLGLVGLITISFYIMRALISLVSGTLSDRIGTRRLLIFAFLISGIVLVGPALWQGAAALIVAGAVLGLLTSAVPVGITALVGETTSSASRQVTLAGFHVWRDLGITIALVVGAYLRSAFGGFREPFLIFAAVFLLSAAVATRLPQAARPTLPADN
jgi:predicted MFS family arabinose efflux permease